ncbi:unnamed protein product [Cylindrotheca closterium]|uniref:Uncharacterized protein n=1 Tax=Cylindrotheca closterium TaxID=2856 RepID=A0AAD2CR98_9STRA|nr:unnamed protein product [Cylindrotheca closterium]
MVAINSNTMNNKGNTTTKMIMAFICGIAVSQFFFSMSLHGDNSHCDEHMLLDGHVMVNSKIPEQAESLTRTLADAASETTGGALRIPQPSPTDPPTRSPTASPIEPKIEPAANIVQTAATTQTNGPEIGSLTYPAFPYHRGVYPLFFNQRPSDFDNRTYWNTEDKCRYSSAWLRAAASSPTQEGGVCRHDNKECPILVHTELLLKRNTSMVDYRKEQLPVLSFLATQHESVKMNILVNEQDHKNPPAWVTALLEHPVYKHRIQLQYWTVDTMDSEGLPDNFLPAFKHAFENLAVPASASDVRRYAVLYDKGGLWFDTDHVYLSDVRPLMGYDYVVVADRNKLNNCAIGTHQRHSEMMKRILHQVVKTYENKNDGKYYRFGPYLFEDMRKDKSKAMPFGVLNACLFDAWGGHAKNQPWWWDFSQKKASKRHMQFLQDRTGPFAYHWHGLWPDKVIPTSSASILHKNYVVQLGLDPEIFKADMSEVDWTPFKDYNPYSGETIPLPESYF